MRSEDAHERLRFTREMAARVLVFILRGNLDTAADLVAAAAGEADAVEHEARRHTPSGNASEISGDIAGHLQEVRCRIENVKHHLDKAQTAPGQKTAFNLYAALSREERYELDLLLKQPDDEFAAQLSALIAKGRTAVARLLARGTRWEATIAPPKVTSKATPAEEPVKCGNCGNDTAKISAVQDTHGIRRLILTCTGCGSRSIVHTTPVRLDLEWADGSEGVFCTGWERD